MAGTTLDSGGLDVGVEAETFSGSYSVLIRDSRSYLAPHGPLIRARR
jgi:hypothetical protein